MYYPPTLRLAPSIAYPSPHPSPTSSVPQSTITSATKPAFGKDIKQSASTPVVELESKEVVKVEQLKWKKKDKEKEVAA